MPNNMPKGHILLFHGSKNGIKGNINVSYSNQLCDFGSSFYLGDNLVQAENRVSNESKPILYAYEYALGSCTEFRFPTAVDWALFVGYNRNKVKLTANVERMLGYMGKCDMIIGPIADDRMDRVFAEFLSGAMTDTALSNCLSYVQYGNQYMIKSQEAVSCLKCIGSYVVTKNMKENSKAVHKKQRESIDVFIEQQKDVNSNGSVYLIIYSRTTMSYTQNEYGNEFTDIAFEYKCNMFGEVFLWSVKDGYESFDFVKTIMTDRRLDKYFICNDIQDWSDDSFLYHTLKNVVGKDIKQGKPIWDDYILWFSGYLYNYMMIRYDFNRLLVYELLPFEDIVDNFNMLHCMDWDACAKFALINHFKKNAIKDRTVEELEDE